MRGQKPQRAHFRTLTQAKRWIQRIESAIHDGRYFSGSDSRKRTVGEMIDKFTSDWLPTHSRLMKKQIALLTWWKDRCGHLFLVDLTPAKIAECRDELLSEITVRGKIRSTSTTNRYLSALGKALNVCMKEWCWIEDSPMR